MTKKEKESKKDQFLEQHFDLMQEIAWNNRYLVSAKKELVKLHKQIDLLETQLDELEDDKKIPNSFN